VASPQGNTLSLSASKLSKDGLPVLTTIHQQKKELFAIIWWLRSNLFHLNSKFKEEDKSFLDRPDQFKVISKNLMVLLRAAAVSIKVSQLQGCLLLKMVLPQVKWCR